MASQNQRVYSLFGDHKDDEMDIIDKKTTAKVYLLKYLTK